MGYPLECDCDPEKGEECGICHEPTDEELDSLWQMVRKKFWEWINKEED